MGQDFNNKQNKLNNQPKLQTKDFISIFWRSGFEQASWNYERMQNLGFAFILSPAIKRLYPEKKDRVAAMKRHLLFFNTSPIMQSLVTGVVLNMEEKKADGQPISANEITSVKTAMMGPLGGIGDPVWNGTIRPVLSALASSVVMSGFGIWGPILFFAAWNVLRLGFRYKAQQIGYRHGTDIIDLFGSGILKTVTRASAVFGMFMTGVFIAKWVKVDFDLTRIVIFRHIEWINSLFSAIAALLLTISCIWLIRHRISPIWVILLLFLLGILGYAGGVFV
ncbi:PTS system mannose/fructose/sorbose family transporter subunit IID [Lentilactobacillus hilgardii]|uniref:PTS system mannose/fructose/sorbose family transporter subunit IID n=1 Tax=Lentilactobacillus hilgardii TaxID=1588 RepID=UPI0021C41A49|nr:PTS system mannose/fructose/sorbose family transporter subunit IID [Lentilactobacillus hilgardii]MCP9332257.1 PTS mannose/fructose/sorbose transporter family subunit IID [Lentilactobacillus hilgardii]MCP9348750.1 PTS mannose/fructose/sorbose transporter family subunit IID [Lentilactobacillus hilgardii]MCP9351671.1 PTS mannose/fructose/sorbose transporter family subunit IID [Lentilactobacillus hilgardii]